MDTLDAEIQRKQEALKEKKEKDKKKGFFGRMAAAMGNVLADDGVQERSKKLEAKGKLADTVLSAHKEKPIDFPALNESLLPALNSDTLLRELQPHVTRATEKAKDRKQRKSSIQNSLNKVKRTLKERLGVSEIPILTLLRDPTVQVESLQKGKAYASSLLNTFFLLDDRVIHVSGETCHHILPGSVKSIRKETPEPNTTVLTVRIEGQDKPVTIKRSGKEKILQFNALQRALEAMSKGQTPLEGARDTGPSREVPGIPLKDGELPVITDSWELSKLSILLMEGEKAHGRIPDVELLEERAVSTWSGTSVGFRAMKGVYLRSSSGSGQSIPTLQKIDSGSLTLTSQRLVFKGTLRAREIPLSKIITLESFADGIAVGTKSAKKKVFFCGRIDGWLLKRCVEVAAQNPMQELADMDPKPAKATSPSEPKASGESTESIPDKIRQLGKLRDEGLISEEEFQAKKNDLLERL
ncbi:MAG: SHOCT domain-containing protein [Planctomycetota bacterium]